MTLTIILAAILGAAAGIAAWCYCACRVGGAADTAIDADWEEVPAEKPGVGLWV